MDEQLKLICLRLNV